MRDSLTLQAGLATAFLAEAWPGALDQARNALSPGRASLHRLLVCGCGDSHCAARGAEFGLRHWTGLLVRAAEAMEASRYLLDDAGPEVLVVGISSSGEVARTVEALETARRAGAQTLAITCSADTTLASVAHQSIRFTLPAFPFGPGLISYLAALEACLAVAATLAPNSASKRIVELMRSLPELVEINRLAQAAAAEAFAAEIAEAESGVFAGSGPCRGAAEFASAKVMEACGLFFRAQDVEEWAHLEYFVATPPMPTWILSASGRSQSREAEVERAARAIGRRLHVSRWEGGPGWASEEREALAPLGLWAGPAAFAQRLAELRNEIPFRDFGGGRSATEGGGPSRIRSSERTGRHTEHG